MDQNQVTETRRLRLHLHMNNRLRLEVLAALSRIFREYNEPISDAVLADLVLAVPNELIGESQVAVEIPNLALFSRTKQAKPRTPGISAYGEVDMQPRPGVHNVDRTEAGQQRPLHTGYDVGQPHPQLSYGKYNEGDTAQPRTPTLKQDKGEKGQAKPVSVPKAKSARAAAAR